MADYINVFALQRFERTGVWAAFRERTFGGIVPALQAVSEVQQKMHIRKQSSDFLLIFRNNWTDRLPTIDIVNASFAHIV